MTKSDSLTSSELLTWIQTSLAFSNPDTVRMRCLEQLLDLPEMPNLRLLVNILLRTLREDPNAVVRHEAAFVLGRLPDLPSDLISDQIVSALCERARIDPSIVVRHEATEVLGNLDDSRVDDVLRELAEDDNPDVALTAKLGLESRA
jgi:HEAT repeat protein